MKTTAVTDETQSLRSLVWDNLHTPGSADMEAFEQETVLQTDTLLVLVKQLQRFTVYWAPELEAVVIRALPPREAAEWLLESVTAAAVTLLQDTGSRRLILDITDMPALASNISEAPWLQLATLTDERLLVTDECDSPQGWYRVTRFTQASTLLRVQGIMGDRTDETLSLLKAHDAVLVGGSYAGCVYWLPRSRTVVFSWGGHDTDQHGTRLLYAAASAYTRYLRVKTVVSDLTNECSLSAKGRSRLQAFIEGAVFRGADRCVLVGDAPIKPNESEESLGDYIAGMNRLIRRVEVTRTLRDALERPADRAQNTSLDS